MSWFTVIFDNKKNKYSKSTIFFSNRAPYVRRDQLGHPPTGSEQHVFLPQQLRRRQPIHRGNNAAYIGRAAEQIRNRHGAPYERWVWSGAPAEPSISRKGHHCKLKIGSCGEIGGEVWAHFVTSVMSGQSGW